jgi:hypothetical protein
MACFERVGVTRFGRFEDQVVRWVVGITMGKKWARLEGFEGGWGVDE